MNTSSAGKGDKPRNCFSKQFKDNYDLIKWKSKDNTTEKYITNIKNEKGEKDSQ